MPKQYRIYFIDRLGRPAGYQDFEAHSDREAELAGWLVFDACADACVAYQVWDDHRCVVDRRLDHGRPAASASEISAALVDLAREIEEALANSRHAVARSRRLLAQLGLQHDPNRRGAS